MKTTFPLLSLLITVLLVSGCSGAQNTPTVTATEPAAQANVFCENISLTLDPALGSGYECQTIPENSGVDLPFFNTNPIYTQVTLKNYPWTDTTVTPQINVFPIQRYNELLPDVLPTRLASLQALISGGTASSTELPLLPVFNQTQMFTGQVAVIHFQNGTGIRFLTQYGQGPEPINNQEMSYTFQGLTADGQYWVSVILPISNASLMADSKNPPDRQSWDDFRTNYQTYIADTTAQLDSQSTNSFAPTINMLDALINSIVVQP
jgi:hypothetical protein